MSNTRQRFRNNGWYVIETTSATTTTNNIHYAWFGSNPQCTGTWDYAPVSEFQEVEPERFERWLYRMNNDTNYASQQLEMNRRHDLWYQAARQNGTVRDSLMCYTYSTNNITGSWTMTSDFNLWNRTKSLWRLSKLCVYMRYHFIHDINLQKRLTCFWKKLQKTKAEKRSWQLTEQWLTPDEFAELTAKGQMEIQSRQDRETIYIVKRDPLARIQVRKAGKVVSELCVVPKEFDCPSGDVFLSKVLLIKTDENKFKSIVRSYTVW